MKGVFYRVRTVALLLVLLFPTFAATYATVTNLPQPICTTVEGSGKKYEICLTDVTYNDQAETSTWTYTARTITGNAISHVTFGIPCGTQASDYTAASGCAAIEYGNDPTTGVNGIKFDCGTGTNTITYSFTIKGLYSIGLIDYAVKTGGAGQREFVFAGYGPSCSSIPVLPDGSACANAVAYLSNYGLITIDDLNTNADVHYNVFVGGDLIRYPGGGDYLGSDGVFSDPTARGLEVAGKVKNGANIKYSGAFFPPPANTISKINANQYQVNGYAYNLNTSGAKLFYDVTLADKAAQIKSDLEAASTQLANAVANNTASGNLTFNVNYKDANGIAVFHIAAGDIAQNANVQLNNNVNANTIIINVSGTNVNWTNGVNVNISQNNWSKILWNFPQATSISVSSLKGIVLAPFATFSSNSANEGSVAVKTYNGNGEIHRPYFAGDFSDLCSTAAPTIALNLTAECKVGNTLYWRVTGDNATNGVAFAWDGPGNNDGSGVVNAGDRFYFTTQNAGGANTTVLSWYDPATGTVKTKTKSHSNQDCVYHIELEKEWHGASAPNLSNTIILTAESSIATATCGYDAYGNWYCDYTSKGNGGSLNDLEVPFGETYSVSENTVNGWITTAGVDESFAYVEGFDNGGLPDALVYQLSSDAYATPIPGGAEKYGMHTVENTALPTGTTSPLCVSQGETFAMDFDTDENGNTLNAGTGIGTRSGFIQPYGNLFGGGKGVTFVSANESNKPLSLYDSEIINGDDPDLQRNEELDGNWAVGNLTDEILGNLLIINQTSNPAIPDDHANGGQLILNADVLLQSFAFDIVDLENVQNDDVIIFENTATGASATVRLSEFLSGSGSPFSVPGVTYGERSANRITSITADKLGISSFNRITFDTDDSFGIGAICVEKAAQVISLNIKVLLGGAVDPLQCLMTNALQAKGIIPTVSPYCDSEIIYTEVNDPNGPAGEVTDWVLVEIRDGNNPSMVIEAQAGLLQVNGCIVNPTGDPLTFSNFSNPIYIVIRHRNHLAISSPLVSVNDGDTYDFTSSLSNAYGADHEPLQLIDCGNYAMWPGDVNADNKVTDNSNPSDAQKVKAMIFCYPDNPFPGAPSFLPPVNTYVVECLYSRYDVNLDGNIKDNAIPSDAQIVKATIINHPNNPFPSAPAFIPASNTFVINEILPFTSDEFCLNYDDLDHLGEEAIAVSFLEAKGETLPQEVNIYPNPNTAPQATLELNSKEEESNVTLLITNLNGQVLKSRRFELAKGFNQFSIETSNLPQGTYLIKILGTEQDYAPMKLVRTRR